MNIVVDSKNHPKKYKNRVTNQVNCNKVVNCKMHKLTTTFEYNKGL
jgi:hypothetical protein